MLDTDARAKKRHRYASSTSTVASKQARAAGRIPSGQTLFRCQDCGYLALEGQRATHAQEQHDIYDPTAEKLAEMFERVKENGHARD